MITIQINKDNDGWISRILKNDKIVLNPENSLPLTGFDYKKTEKTSIDNILDEYFNYFGEIVNNDDVKIEYLNFPI